MRRHTFWLAIALLLAAAAPRVARACPLCADAATATSGADEDDAMREARAYNTSIFLMAGTPYLMLGGVGYWVYRGIRRHNALTAVPDDAAPNPDQPAPNPGATNPGATNPGATNPV